ncbi:hypothetical protein [Rossellomorea marisflavi]|uniref:hypothetical protein n=1 Tax=Rossellomorea marisflavi TaxID=189381 RepID=UPI00345A9DF8
MKKVLFLILTLFLILYGCSNKEEQPEGKPIKVEQAKGKPIKDIEYDGENHLEIAVLGNDKAIEELSKSISYDKYSIDELIKALEGNDAREYDAIIVFKDSFKSVDDDKYSDFFSALQYPVFLVGADNFRAYALYTKGSDINKARDDTAPYVQGFKSNNSNEKSQAWSFDIPEEVDSKIINKYALVNIFDILDSEKSKEEE